MTKRLFVVLYEVIKYLQDVSAGIGFFFLHIRHLSVRALSNTAIVAVCKTKMTYYFKRGGREVGKNRQ
jgi:hypothetical protein